MSERRDEMCHTKAVFETVAGQSANRTSWSHYAWFSSFGWSDP